MYEIILMLIAGFFAALIGTMSGGGGGFIAFLSLVSLGIPIKAVIATNTLGDVGVYPLSVKNFFSAKKIKKKLISPIIVLSVLGAVVGLYLVITVNEEILKKSIAFLLILVLIFILEHPKFGLKKYNKNRWWPFFYFLTAAYVGFFGPGSGLFAMLVLCSLCGLKLLEANAINLIGNFFSSFTRLLVFIYLGLVDYSLGIPLFIGTLIGGYVGSKIAIKKGNKWVRNVLVVVIIITIIRLLVG